MRLTPSVSLSLSMRRRKGSGVLAAAAASLVASLLVVPATSVSAASDDDATVVADWNALAVKTLVGDPTKPGPVPFIYIGFVQAAVYNAVVGIGGRYQPYRFDDNAPPGASMQAAAVAAAHKVLVTYAPYATMSLNDAYDTSLLAIPDGRAKSDGITFGELAADRLIGQRIGDGRDAAITFDQLAGPGVWRPTPPANAPMLAPWLAFVKPLLLTSGAQFGLPGPPPALSSGRYTKDFAEVKEMGSVGSTARTPDQTAEALFFSGNAVVQFDDALRDQVSVRQLDIVDAAHVFAVVTMTQADTLISVWRAKYVYGFWRPITAIRLADTDGNPATDAETTWTPLLTTPPYPDYVSGYSGQTGAFTRSLAGALGTARLQLTLISTAVPGATRTYKVGEALNKDVVDARIWLGIHFRTADTRAVQMGTHVANWVLENYFQRLEGADG